MTTKTLQIECAGCHCVGECICDAAREAAGNWRDFDSFAWTRPFDGSLENPDDWTIVYTHNRDSDLIEVSNASVVAEELAPFVESDNPDVISESHSHWMCGWIDGFTIRVFRDGAITAAYRKWLELLDK